MYARSLGNADDDGHMIGKQLGGSGGKKLPTARASPSCLTTSALPCRHLTITATRYGSRSLTSTDDSGNAPLRSYRSSTRDNMRIRRRDFIIIGSATTTQGLEAYISPRPDRLAGNNPTLYGYVKDANDMLDILG